MQRLRFMAFAVVLLFATMVFPAQGNAQYAIVEAVKAASKKIIKAVDLSVQRLQNGVIDLQNAQRVLENMLSSLRLQDIASWTQQQKELYQGYFDELWQIKTALSYADRLRYIVQLEKQLYQEYSSAWGVLQKNGLFNPIQLRQIDAVYAQYIDQSVAATDDLIRLMGAFSVQMSDAQRLALIDQVTQELTTLIRQLRAFTGSIQNLSRERAAKLDGLNKLLKLYGLQ